MSFADKLAHWIKNECPKGTCEICKKEFPDIKLMHISKSDQRITCIDCAMDESKRRADLIFGKVKEFSK